MWPKNVTIQIFKNFIFYISTLDAKNFKGDTALHTMIGHGRLDCVMALISYGANVNAKDDGGNTPLHIGRYIIPN